MLTTTEYFYSKMGNNNHIPVQAQDFAKLIAGNLVDENLEASKPFMKTQISFKRQNYKLVNDKIN